MCGENILTGSQIANIHLLKRAEYQLGITVLVVCKDP